MAFTDTEIAETHDAVRKAGQSEDLYKLGLIYSIGDDANLVQAHMWFNLAAARGSEAAKECRRELADLMSKDEIANAQRAAREWLSTATH
jgi:uncharacterized protein